MNVGEGEDGHLTSGQWGQIPAAEEGEGPRAHPSHTQSSMNSNTQRRTCINSKSFLQTIHTICVVPILQGDILEPARSLTLKTSESLLLHRHIRHTKYTKIHARDPSWEHTLFLIYFTILMPISLLGFCFFVRVAVWYPCSIKCGKNTQ